MNEVKKVTIKEVGPRDGLQNERKVISTEDKVNWINQLSKTGLSYIEVTSFVHPKWIPALADALKVVKGMTRSKHVTYAALVPNRKGLERAIEADIDEVAPFLSASESHNRKNLNQSIDDTLKAAKQVVREAKEAGKESRGYISTVFGCPYEKKVDVNQLLTIIESLLEMGVYEISLGDTIGVANPMQVQSILEMLLNRYPREKFALHFHNTHGTALANTLASLQMGMTTFDASTGGLGGCPYAPGASGNVATEDLVFMLHGMGIETGIDNHKLLASAQWMEQKIGRTLPSHNLQVGNR